MGHGDVCIVELCLLVMLKEKEKEKERKRERCNVTVGKAVFLFFHWVVR